MLSAQGCCLSWDLLHILKLATALREPRESSLMVRPKARAGFPLCATVRRVGVVPLHTIGTHLRRDYYHIVRICHRWRSITRTLSRKRDPPIEPPGRVPARHQLCRKTGLASHFTPSSDSAKSILDASAQRRVQSPLPLASRLPAPTISRLNPFPWIHSITASQTAIVWRLPLPQALSDDARCISTVLFHTNFSRFAWV